MKQSEIISGRTYLGRGRSPVKRKVVSLWLDEGVIQMVVFDRLTPSLIEGNHCTLASFAKWAKCEFNPPKD